MSHPRALSSNAAIAAFHANRPVAPIVLTSTRKLTATRTIRIKVRERVHGLQGILVCMVFLP